MNTSLRLNSFTGFNTQPPEGGWRQRHHAPPDRAGFNTQPPEGGWANVITLSTKLTKFQHTAARRRLVSPALDTLKIKGVSTHSRPKAAGCQIRFIAVQKLVSTHSRPKAAGKSLKNGVTKGSVSTHSRPKAAGTYTVFFLPPTSFQHTAARRRLDKHICIVHICIHVSTHSRPKAAGASLKSLATSGFASLISLNSQEKQKCEYNTAFSVIPTFAIS